MDHGVVVCGSGYILADVAVCKM